jgi:hypothetical protein
MIKGVNKQVLEINETQNSFFEKAIFFVKPEYSGMAEGRLRESAKKELDNSCSPPSQRRFHHIETRTLIFSVVCFFLGIAMGFFGSSVF